MCLALHKGSSRRRRRLLIACAAAFVLGSCGGGDSTPHPTYTLSATLFGLSASGLVLAVNGSDVAVAAGATTAPLASGLNAGAAYTVSVATQPTGEVCQATPGSGTVGSADVDVAIGCLVTYSVLYSFAGNPNGSTPNGGIIQASDGNFYGTTQYGGTSCDGIVFAITTAGAETVVQSFGKCSQGTDRDGPIGNLVQASDGNFYGTTLFGGTSGSGTVFELTTAGVATALYSFLGGSDGMNPNGDLIQASDGNFYGTTTYGGTDGVVSDEGTVFRVTPEGVETVLHSFVGTDGANPAAGLVEGTDGNLYGTTNGGGSGDNGTAFRITPAGVLTVLHVFSGSSSDGAKPTTLIQGQDGNFYGVTAAGGTSNNGTVFEISSTGTGTVLYSFARADGSWPISLIQASDGNFYGTTLFGGATGNGTAFRVTPDGVATVLHAFGTGATDGINPNGLVQGIDGNLYGTTAGGGTSNQGTVFRIVP
jgi:uncharacterized repeat protein (TIGR03803 family)